MPLSCDRQVLADLSAFDDAPHGGDHRYAAASWCRSQTYLLRSPAGALEAVVRCHAGTAWVSLRGLLDRRTSSALAAVLVGAGTADVVLDATDLELAAAWDELPLLALCTTVGRAGCSVAVVGYGDSPTAASGREHGSRAPRPGVTPQLKAASAGA